MPPHHRYVPASRALAFIDRERIDRLLSSLVPEPAEREFVTRCLVDEGPIHHRGANYVLLMLLGEALQRLPERDPLPSTEIELPMRLPPHLEKLVDRGTFPLSLPTGALRDLVGEEESHLAAAIDCLTDGPPQHALANVAMVALLERLLHRLQ